MDLPVISLKEDVSGGDLSIAIPATPAVIGQAMFRLKVMRMLPDSALLVSPDTFSVFVNRLEMIFQGRGWFAMVWLGSGCIVSLQVLELQACAFESN